jgi:hypothetical protein
MRGAEHRETVLERLRTAGYWLSVD